MRALRIVFAGTPEFAVPALRALIDSDHRPAAVLTQPDRGAGRGRKLTIGPVKQLALDAGIEVLQPVSLKEPAARQRIAELKPDLLITAAYGLLLPQAVLDMPAHGCWNLHASLLPRWRGASPINQAILAGDDETGISLMQMEAGLDTGPVLLQVATPIKDHDDAGSLHDRLARMAAPLLMDALDRLVRGSLPSAVPQNPDLATHAPLIAKPDAELDWADDAEFLARQVRAYNPWPVAHATIAGLACRIFRARALDDDELDHGPALPAGQLLRDPSRRESIVVACGKGALEILQLQAPGRKRVSARDWLNARPDWV